MGFSWGVGGKSNGLVIARYVEICFESCTIWDGIFLVG